MSEDFNMDLEVLLNKMDGDTNEMNGEVFAIRVHSSKKKEFKKLGAKFDKELNTWYFKCPPDEVDNHPLEAYRKDFFKALIYPKSWTFEKRNAFKGLLPDGLLCHPYADVEDVWQDYVWVNEETMSGIEQLLTKGFIE